MRYCCYKIIRNYTTRAKITQQNIHAPMLKKTRLTWLSKLNINRFYYFSLLLIVGSFSLRQKNVKIHPVRYPVMPRVPLLNVKLIHNSHSPYIYYFLQFLKRHFNLMVKYVRNLLYLIMYYSALIYYYITLSI